MSHPAQRFSPEAARQQTSAPEQSRANVRQSLTQLKQNTGSAALDALISTVDTVSHDVLQKAQPLLLALSGMAQNSPEMQRTMQELLAAWNGSDRWASMAAKSGDIAKKFQDTMTMLQAQIATVGAGMLKTCAQFLGGESTFLGKILLAIMNSEPARLAHLTKIFAEKTMEPGFDLKQLLTMIDASQKKLEREYKRKRELNPPDFVDIADQVAARIDSSMLEKNAVTIALNGIEQESKTELAELAKSRQVAEARAPSAPQAPATSAPASTSTGAPPASPSPKA